MKSPNAKIKNELQIVNENWNQKAKCAAAGPKSTQFHKQEESIASWRCTERGFMDNPKPRQPAENVTQSRPWASAKKPTKVMATREPQMSGPRGKLGPYTLSIYMYILSSCIVFVGVLQGVRDLPCFSGCLKRPWGFFQPMCLPGADISRTADPPDQPVLWL